MESFEAKLASATDPDHPTLLAAIGLVVDNKGNTLYHHAAGRQTLTADAPAVDPSSTVTLGSAGKFITYVAALQCVERGLITLDEPVHTHLHALDKFDIISPNKDADPPFTLRRPAKKITLRHLLTHSSGIAYRGHPLVDAWKASPAGEAAKPADDAPLIVRLFSMPLLHEPGEGWTYGSSVEWTWLLIERLTGQSTLEFVEQNIFAPLGMTHSTYQPRTRPEVWDGLLQMVSREGEPEHLVPAPENSVQGLACSIPNIGCILSDLISPTPKILKQETADLIFKGQFAASGPELKALRAVPDDYAKPAGIPPDATNLPVNHSLIGLFVEDTLPLSHFPAGTVTWNGMPNVIWAINKQKGLAMLFATQLLPVDDTKTVEIAMMFMREAWAKFG